MDFLPGIKIDLTPLVSVAARGSEVVGKLLFGDLVNWQKAKDAYAAAQCEKNVQKIKDGEFEYENGEMHVSVTRRAIFARYVVNTHHANGVGKSFRVCSCCG